MERVHVDVIAAPRNRLTARGKLQTRKIDDRASRSVLAGNPFRIDERQGPRRNRHRQARVKKFAWRFGSVDAENDGGRGWTFKTRFAGGGGGMKEDTPERRG